MADQQPRSLGSGGRREPSQSVQQAATSDGLKTAGQFLRTVAKVLKDQALYPENHPQLTAAVMELQTAMKDLFTEQKDRTFVFIEGQVYCDDRLLGLENQDDIARAFRKIQVEVLTLRRGVSWDELRSFLDYMAASRRERDRRRLFQSAHIELGDLSSDKNDGPKASAEFQEMSVGISRSALGRSQFADEASILRDVYIDWKSAQEMLINHVDRIMQTLQKALFANFNSLIPLGDLKSYDEYTYVHAINLSILTMAQAEALGFSRAAIHAFGIGALLHDVGKTQLSVDVLNKHGRLTPEEFEEMKRHPIHGAALLFGYPEIPRIAAIVAYEHHLRFDRTGYPTMKRNRPQHIASRLTAIADQFDAMRSNRPYREALEPEKIFAIMQEDEGAALDPDLVEQFIAMMKSRQAI